ncbi:DNA-binding NarL/FixJ family response regulator [Saccharopolyspora lacisalsi]|uniref:DNA-binding NarL/FixJ family response regulator n=2 Tax=Halosaccharopolyspora lacisalsi TaxID=1000566 RepID=A0A839DZD2_9PSEU|nr:DNA-binding NarL/FixJ family response regulator [Halosaccharopolyspora lacisalsi]
MTSMAISTYLDSRPGIEVVPSEQLTPIDVVVIAAERLTVETSSTLRKVKATMDSPVVLILSETSRDDLVTAVECNVAAVLPREAATGDRIEHAVFTAADGGGFLSTSMLGELLKQFERVQREVLSPHGLHVSGLTPREIDVLRLMSHGLDTTEIADELCFSERAVKRVVSGVTGRLKLRNRPHAVAYALRMGVI